LVTVPGNLITGGILDVAGCWQVFLLPSLAAAVQNAEAWWLA
jgi:hypothetical protein